MTRSCQRSLGLARFPQRTAQSVQEVTLVYVKLTFEVYLLVRFLPSTKMKPDLGKKTINNQVKKTPVTPLLIQGEIQ